MQKSEYRSLVRPMERVFDPELLRKIRKHLDQVEIERQQKASSEREHKAIQRGESSDALRMDRVWYEVWRAPSPSLMEMLGPFSLVVFPVQVRLVRSLKHFVPWHQDIGYQRVLKHRGHRQIFTCFIPLDENPSHRTTLQFALGEYGELAHEPSNGFAAGLKENNFRTLKHYSLKLGDCLVFGDLAIHRTFLPENGEVERRSLEFRLISPEDVIEDKDYFDPNSGFFVRKNGTKRSWPL